MYLQQHIIYDTRLLARNSRRRRVPKIRDETRPRIVDIPRYDSYSSRALLWPHLPSICPVDLIFRERPLRRHVKNLYMPYAVRLFVLEKSARRNSTKHTLLLPTYTTTCKACKQNC